ncbi:glycosyltransferase [Exiguobacterium alkaliphilum]|uniref:glycosyltransferase n=1 Tax=Exiguobacterium alkaliphilum TaxID=1428684 RepID=UPI0012DCC8A4|nr:glycosyltransferase [Exiguobacterium alkaliphilum]
MKLVLSLLDFKDDLIGQSYVIEILKVVPQSVIDDIEIIEDGVEPEIFRNKIDVLLRPNYSDSFGLSVIECLSEGIPVIASDVCMRPKGCRTFSNRNELELENELRYMMNHYKDIYNEINSYTYKGSLKETLKIYENIMNRKGVI